jgi:hypothetical protein
MRIPSQSAGAIRNPQNRRKPDELVNPAFLVIGSDGSFYNCERTYSEGSGAYYDCRKLRPDFQVGGSYCRTETKCELFSLFCNDHCWRSNGSEHSSGWYWCGVCLEGHF